MRQTFIAAGKLATQMRTFPGNTTFLNSLLALIVVGALSLVACKTTDDSMDAPTPAEPATDSMPPADSGVPTVPATMPTAPAPTDPAPTTS